MSRQLCYERNRVWGGRLERQTQNHKCELLTCCVFAVEYYENPAASDPLLPDLQMDRAAQWSHSYKIGLAWRYNSFSLYVFCQINLASLGAILVLVTQSIEEVLCVATCPRRALGNILVCPTL